MEHFCQNRFRYVTFLQCLRDMTRNGSHIKDLLSLNYPVSSRFGSLYDSTSKSSKSCHIVFIIRCLHWFRITERIEYKLFLLTKFSQLPILHTFKTLSLFNVFAVLAFIRRYSCSATIIFA